MTSTLAVEELSSATRVPRRPRVLDALNPESAKNVKQYYDSAATRNDAVARASLRRPWSSSENSSSRRIAWRGLRSCCLSSIAGYSDQRTSSCCRGRVHR